MRVIVVCCSVLLWHATGQTSWAQLQPELLTAKQFLAEAPVLGEQARVRVRATVTHVISDRTYVIQEGGAGVYVFHKPDPAFHPGEIVEVTGNPSLGGLAPSLQNCSAQLVGVGDLPPPLRITGAETLHVTNSMKLVQIEARIVDEKLMGGRLIVARPSDHFESIQINLEAIESLKLVTPPEPGALLEVTGVLVIKSGPDRQPASATILVQSLAGLRVLAGPPFWNIRRIGRIAAGMAVALTLILIWVLLLRHQVKSQTRLIEQRFEREAALKALEDRFAKVFRSGPDSLLITRVSDDVIIEANPAFEDLAGLRRPEIVGRRESELGIWIDAGDQKRALASVTAKGSLKNCECRLRSRAGKEAVYIYAAESIDLNGEPCRLGVFRDITEQKKNEEERRGLQTQLERAQRMESLGTLAGGIAHDFNNILAGILGNADLARQTGELSRETSQSLDEIRSASLRGRDLVQRILAFSRPQPEKRQPIALGPVVAEAASLLRAAMPPGVWLETHLDPNCPPVLADPTQIHQIVMNLGTNAGHAMEGRPGRVRIHVCGVTVDPAAGPLLQNLKPGHYACLSVADEGVGMIPTVRERIFEPFFTTKELGKGTGLGLAAVHAFVKNHGGAVDVQTEPGRGSTFLIYLPPTDRPPEMASATAKANPAAAKDGLEILLVDDEEMVASVVKRMLERFGHRVSSFLEPAEALALLEREPARFNLVLTDMNMPSMTGLDVAKRARELRPDIRIILASGNVSSDLREQARQVGASQVISKPITMSELEAVVRGPANG